MAREPSSLIMKKTDSFDSACTVISPCQLSSKWSDKVIPLSYQALKINITYLDYHLDMAKYRKKKSRFGIPRMKQPTSTKLRKDAEKEFRMAEREGLNKFANAFTGGLWEDGRIVFHLGKALYLWIWSYVRKDSTHVKGHWKRIR